MLEFRLIL